MKNYLKVAVLLSGAFAGSCFAVGATAADAAAYEQLKTQGAETNALLKELIKQGDGVSEQSKTACYFDGKLYTQGAVVDNGKQFCSMENGSPKIRPTENK
ncbi:TPA: DUF1496 domain-containing protein [Salmonella enterica]